MAAASSSNNAIMPNSPPISYDEQLEVLVINAIGEFIYRGVRTKWEHLRPDQRLESLRSMNPATFSPSAVNFLAYVERRAESQTRGIPYVLEDRFAEAMALCALFPENTEEIMHKWMNESIMFRYEYLMRLREIRHAAIIDFIIAHYRHSMGPNVLELNRQILAHRVRQAEEAEIAERARVAAETEHQRRIAQQEAEAGWAAMYRRPNLWGGSKGLNKRRGGTRHRTHHKKRRTHHKKRHTGRKHH